jgi:HEAT repeat protein
MPREQLLGLAADVDRLFSAGASAAAGNDNLIRRAKTLRDLGQKVAALNPVADAVERVTQAAPKQIGPAFLDLVGVTRQVRASLAAPGAEGALEPLPKSGPWQTPAPLRSLWALHETLSQPGTGREAALEGELESRLIGDLRLLPALLGALDDKNATLAQRAATEWLPSLGKAILPDLQNGLDLQGKRADARRVQAICRIDAKVGAELCRKALREGSGPLRIQALECLPDVGNAGEAEKEGLALAQDKSRDVRMAALTALRCGTSSEALEILVTGLADRDDLVRRSAHESLAELPNAQTTPRLLQELERRLQELDEAKPPAKKGGTKAGAKKAAAAKVAASSARQSMIRDVTWVVEALAQRKDKQRAAAAQAILPLVGHKEKDIRVHAVRSLGWVGAATPDVVPTLIAALKDKLALIEINAVNALADLPPEQREPALPALFEFLKSLKKDDHLRGTILLMLPGHVGRYRDQVLAALGESFKMKVWAASEALEQCGPAARPLLPEIFKAIKAGQAYGYNCNRDFLVSIDPEGTSTIPELLPMLDERKGQIRCLALQFLASYGPKAKAALPRIKELANDKDYFVRSWAEDTLTKIG